MVLKGDQKTMESKHPDFGQTAQDFDNALADYKARFGKPFPGEGRKRSRYLALKRAIDSDEEATVSSIEAFSVFDR